MKFIQQNQNALVFVVWKGGAMDVCSQGRITECKNVFVCVCMRVCVRRRTDAYLELTQQQTENKTKTLFGIGRCIKDNWSECSFTVNPVMCRRNEVR